MDFSKLLNNLGINFKNRELLETSFTHRSYLNEVKNIKFSNERMEFLGDSVLSFIISTYLYNIRPNDPEGDLTNLRSYIVKTETLANISKKLELGTYLKLSKGEELSGGRDNTQLLANTFEALLGAIFLDQGVEVAGKVLERILLPEVREEIEKGPPKDSKSELQEVVQLRTKKSPFYKILKTSGPDHTRKFLVGVFVNGKLLAEGSGFSKQAAEEEAAKEALEKL
ncbi:MAG: ribonuclease III [Microgenomates group bacterium Gr01-1014_93]|nr:MAG: ribonuclease III [Microgenomates group bacterium Gr01-1014_93]